MNKKLIWIIVLLALPIVMAISMSRQQEAIDMESYTFNSSQVQITQYLNQTLKNCSGNATLCNWNINKSMQVSSARYSNDFIRQVTLTENGTGFRPAFTQILTLPIVQSNNSAYLEPMEIRDSSSNLLCSNYRINDSLSTIPCAGMLYNGNGTIFNPVNVSANSSATFYVTYGKGNNFALNYNENSDKNSTTLFQNGILSSMSSSFKDLQANYFYEIISDAYTGSPNGCANERELYFYKINGEAYFKGCVARDDTADSGNLDWNISYNEVLLDNVTYNFSHRYTTSTCDSIGSFDLYFYYYLIGDSGQVQLGRQYNTQPCTTTTQQGYFPDSTNIILNKTGDLMRVYNSTYALQNTTNVSAVGANPKLYFKTSFSWNSRIYGNLNDYWSKVTKNTEAISFNKQASDQSPKWNFIGLNKGGYAINSTLLNYSNLYKLWESNSTNNISYLGINTSYINGLNSWLISQLGIYGEILWYHQISAGSSVDSVAVQPTYSFAQTSLLNASVSANAATIREVNFTLIKPNGVYCTNNQNGTNSGSYWVSPYCLLNVTGQYNYTITSYDDVGSNTYSNSFSITDTISINITNISTTLEANQPQIYNINLATDTPINATFTITDNSNQTCFQNVIVPTSIKANSSGSSFNYTIQSKPTTSCEGNWTWNLTIQRTEYQYNISIPVNVTINTTLQANLSMNYTGTWTATLNADSNETANFTIILNNTGNYNATSFVAYSESHSQISARLSITNSTYVLQNKTAINVTISLWSHGLGTNSWLGTIRINASSTKYNVTKSTVNSFNYNIGTSGTTIVVITGGGGGGGEQPAYSYCGSNTTLFDVYEKVSGGKTISKAYIDGATIQFTLQFKSLFNGSAIEVKDSCALRSGTDLCDKLIRKSTDLKINLNELRSIDYELPIAAGTKSPTELNLNFDVCGVIKPVKLTLTRSPIVYYIVDKGILSLGEYISDEGSSDVAVGKYKIIKWIPMLAIPLLFFVGLFALLKTLIKKKSWISWVIPFSVSLASFIGVLIF